MAGLPPWFLWSTGIVAATATAVGLVLNLRKERVKIKFAFEAGYASYSDELGDTFDTPGLEITLTGYGKKLSIRKFICRFRPKTSETMTERQGDLNNAELSEGKPVSGWIAFHCEPAMIDEIIAVDSTKKEWKPSILELSAARSECERRWPASN